MLLLGPTGPTAMHANKVLFFHSNQVDRVFPSPKTGNTLTGASQGHPGRISSGWDGRPDVKCRTKWVQGRSGPVKGAVDDTGSLKFSFQYK